MLKRILVADDQPLARELLVAILSHNGYVVEEAIDGRDAVRRAVASLPDLILLDIQMPGLNGFEVCRELRSEACLARIPIVAVTASLMGNEKERALAAGFSDFLSKPVSAVAVRKLVAGLLYPQPS
jgi:CheY-like chemotaxis protein